MAFYNQPPLPLHPISQFCSSTDPSLSFVESPGFALAFARKFENLSKMPNDPLTHWSQIQQKFLFFLHAKDSTFLNLAGQLDKGRTPLFYSVLSSSPTEFSPMCLPRRSCFAQSSSKPSAKYYDLDFETCTVGAYFFPHFAVSLHHIEVLLAIL